MANPVFTPPIDPSVGSEPNNEVRVLTAQFGDGYRQTAPDGLNARRLVWRLRWNRVTKVWADQIVDFLNARQGSEIFEWTPPGEAVAKQFRCSTWTPPIPRTGADVFDVRATFEEAFDPT